MLESLFNKGPGLRAYIFIKKRLQHRHFPVNITKFLRTAFFKEHPWWLLLVTRINRTKFQGQHAAQFNFCRYEGLCPATKTEIHRGCFHLPNFRTTTFENIFWELFLKRKQRRRKTRSDPFVFRFLLFPRQLFINSGKNVLSPQIFA